MNDIDRPTPIEDLRLDLNLLKTFLVLMEERHVTRAAERVHVSQSAMSHALRRLREGLSDELFVSTSSGMAPTQRALELERPVREALNAIRTALAPPPAFDPASSSRSFILGSTDYVEYVLLPPLMRRLHTVGPNIDLRLQPFAPDTDQRLLETGEVDLAVHVSTGASRHGLRSQQLFSEPLVILLRHGHPATRAPLDLEHYCRLQHAAVDSVEAGLGLDAYLARFGLQRRVHLRTPNFLSMPMMLAETDMVATLPEQLASRFTRGGRLTTLPLPYEPAPLTVNLFWHAIAGDDPGNRWLREQIRQICEEIVDRRP